MAKGKKGRRPKGPRIDADTKGGTSASEARTDLIEKIDMHNDRFSKYYKAQRIVPEGEWEPMLDAFRQHLPTTFRVAGSRQMANTLNTTIKGIHVPSLSNVIFEDQQIPPPVQIPWYPDGLAWQFNVPKKVLRKQPEFRKFHSFLVFETAVGNISRQEAVSMIPPLFLDVEPHHKVMDMCAAPGSKTAQILDSLHAQDTLTSTSIPTGLLIANDSDNKRTHLLIHQSARLPSPALMVTNLDASNYPVIRIPGPGIKRPEQLLFDRILCDVPCSGDGTLRKNMGIWKSWQPMDGNGLHGLQVRILQRAMRMLHSGGRIVYSTCSLNPVENEAVVAEALRTNPDFEIVNVSSKFPELHRRPGLTSWKPAVDRSAEVVFESHSDFLASSVAESVRARLLRSHWPPDNVDDLHLTRCMRVYPHLQDTGGFFIAVLEKRKKEAQTGHNSTRGQKRDAADVDETLPDPKRLRIHDTNELSSTSVEPSSSIIDPDEVAIERQIASNSVFKENPYTFLSPDDGILFSCLERLNITRNFPFSNVLVRNPEGDAIRSLYLANDVVKAVIQHNDYQKLRLTAAGTKVFTKQEAGRGSDAQYRVLGEGLPVVLPYIDPTTILTGNLSTLRTLIQSYYPLCTTFEASFRQVIDSLSPGSHIVKFLPEGSEDATLTHDLVLPIWKSNVSLTLMIDKKAKSALSLRLFGHDISTVGKAGPVSQSGVA